MYDDFKPIQYLKVIKEYFPKKSKVDYSKLQLSTDSIYSITRPSESLKMIRILKHAFKSIDTILVGTANVGTTTIAFAEHYKQIYAVEIDETTYDHLKTNIRIYGYKNVEVIHEDIIVFMKSKLKTIHYNPVTYLLFLDPPWSGVFYKTEQNIDLYLSGINVIDFIKSIHVKYVCMKVPFNYNISKLYTSFYNFTIYRLSGFLVVLIIL
jgi:predicted RNA methylase